MPDRRSILVLLAALVTGLSVGISFSAFSSQTSNTGNTFSAAASFGPEFVKQLGTNTCQDWSSTVDVPAGGVAPGNTVVVSLVLRGGAAGGVSASDRRGNSYSRDADVTNSSVRVVTLSSRVATALAAGDTITVSHPFANTSQGVAAVEFSGVLAGARVDQTAEETGNNNSPSASLTTTNDRGVLVGAVGLQNNRNMTEASGWTSLEHVGASCGGAPGRSTLHTAYRIVSSSGSYAYSPTISNSERWAEALVAYKG